MTKFPLFLFGLLFVGITQNKTNNMKTKVRLCQTVAIKKYPITPKFLSKERVLISKNNLKNG